MSHFNAGALHLPTVIDRGLAVQVIRANEEVAELCEKQQFLRRPCLPCDSKRDACKHS